MELEFPCINSNIHISIPCTCTEFQETPCSNLSRVSFCLVNLCLRFLLLIYLFSLKLFTCSKKVGGGGWHNSYFVMCICRENKRGGGADFTIVLPPLVRQLCQINTLYTVLSDRQIFYVDLLLIHVSKNLKQKVYMLVPYICRLVIFFLLFNGQ